MAPRVVWEGRGTAAEVQVNKTLLGGKGGLWNVEAGSAMRV
jgi:hypothetical protein